MKTKIGQQSKQLFLQHTSMLLKRLLVYFRGGNLSLRIETASFDVEAFLMDFWFNIEGAEELIVALSASDFVAVIDVNASLTILHLLGVGIFSLLLRMFCYHVPPSEMRES